MKKSSIYTYISGIIIVMGALVAVSASTAQATVGGPTYIGSFTYNKADESVYYQEVSQGGRGCPPELKKISLVDEKVTTVFSCDQGEKLSGGDYTEGVSLVAVRIGEMTKGFKELTPISLPKNNIQIDIDFVREEKMGTEDWIIQTHFLAKVYHKGVKIDEFPIAGCNQEQLFAFAGYAIPGFEKKIVVLSSTKGDCFEGGYTMERLHVVGGVSALNKEYSGPYKFLDAPLMPSESTLVVFEKDRLIQVTTSSGTENGGGSPDDWDSLPVVATTVIVALIAMIIGLFIGKVYFKQK